MVVARYRTGPEFTVFYYLVRFGSSCRNPQPDPSDSSVPMPDYLPVDPNAIQTSSGEIAQRCETGEGPRVAFASTKTALYGKIWQVPEIMKLYRSSRSSSYRAQYRSSHGGNLPR